jgi:hypothetical protein
LFGDEKDLRQPIENFDGIIDIAALARHIAVVGHIAVARLTQGISPKHCNSPARRAKDFWRYV